MAEGSLAVVPQRLGSSAEGMQLAAAKNKTNLWEETRPFSKLAVQAVGVRPGADDQGVVVYVSKGTARLLKSLPKEIEDVPIIVRKIGLVSIRAEQVNKAMWEPNVFLQGERIACGSSCASAGGDAGTFGALVKIDGDDSIYMLSNNHVLAGCNHIPPGMPILSPSPDDARPGLLAPQSIAELSKAVPMRSGDPRHVKPCEEDVALGLVVKPDLVSSWQGNPEEGYDTPAELVDPVQNMRVKKFGRTTGLTIGTVDSRVEEPIPIPCLAKGFKGNVWFENVWYVLGVGSRFALPGDSGSLVVTEDGQSAVGLVFSSNPGGEIGLMIPIRHVAKELGVTLLNGHGVP
jgi:hypothetical protein